ncbi:hypothetical protein G6F59_015827 [Rhizopus arrhizus]|nr:hypothetical protein G6F59_015827 [Rhizopus arrhizus]
MLAFGFPPSLVHSLESLFFGNAVRININGYFTNRIDQRRGLRQGDPLSPLLFNIALEPFLRHILQDSSFQGFQFQLVSNSVTTTSNTMPPPLKVLAYADDVCVLLHSTDDYCRLHHHLDRYGSVFIAKSTSIPWLSPDSVFSSTTQPTDTLASSSPGRQPPSVL